MKIFTFLGILCGTILVLPAAAQNGWPKTTTAANGTVVKLYEWQPESYSDNKLKARAAISVLESGKTEPVFGVAWLEATTTTNGAQIAVQSIYITDIRLPGEKDDEKLEAIAVALEKQAPSWNLQFSQAELLASLELNEKEANLTEKFNNTPPKVIYSNVPSILVLIDGEPKFQHNSEWGVDAVVNTPFAIVRHSNGRYYLYGGKHWYTATAVTGQYSMTTEIPSNLHKVAEAVNQANKNKAEEKDANTIYKIIVSTEPAELIQTNGEANFAAVNGTGLLYVSNTENDIFMDINTQQYYVLLSGRWYRSKTLNGNWQYIAPDQLPADFAKIPAGSPKDNVLASVAGTPQAEDAVKEAQVPQTAKVDRKNAKASITYDGDPEFELIEGTDMYYAVNSPVSVIRWRGRYFAVDNGIWFESHSAWGPWTVCVTRPHVVALIPPRYPVYYVKYVYVYDYTPDFVYVGYTPGYLNTYVCGPVVVYGTGYYYRPWYRHYYYPRPCTWGYGVRYNPWYGWGINIGFSTGWFHVNIGFGNARPWGYWGYGGWWGPPVYRPPYCYAPVRYGGYYGGGGWYGPYYASNRSRNVNVNVTNITYNNITINNNIYRNRRDVVVTNDNQRYVRPAVRSNGNNNFAGNNRFNSTNRFANFNSERNNMRNGSADRVHNQRQYNLNGNNNAVPDRNNTGNLNTWRRNREAVDNRPAREWSNNNNNRIANRNATTPGNSPREVRDRNWRTNERSTNGDNTTHERRNWNTNSESPNRTIQPNREPERREFSRPGNNNRTEADRRLPERQLQNREPVRREFSGPDNNRRTETERRSPVREVQRESSRTEPARRTMERPRMNTEQRVDRSPQVQRRQETNRPPTREAVRRHDVQPRNGGSEARPSRGGNGNGGERGRGGRGN